MKVLITGANGLLGQKLLKHLQDNPDIELFATTRSGTALPFGAVFLPLDITDERSVNACIRSVSPEVVIHTAAMTQVDKCEQNRDACWKVNVEGVRFLTTACSAMKSYFIHLSTDFIFNGEEGPLAEDAKPEPVNYYGVSKLAGEVLVRASNLNWCIIRTVLVYGITHDMGRSNIILWVKKNLEEGMPIRVVDDQWRTPTLAEDLAMGCWLAASRRAEGTFHISGKDMLSPYEIALKTASFFDLNAKLIIPTRSDQLNQAARRPLKTGFNIEKARHELAYEPHSFDEGMRIMAAQISK
jgi:dTDP-4-dehydrorhamnose reductase